MKKEPYTKPMVCIVRKQRHTLKQFKEDFDKYLQEDSEFENAIITDIRMVDNSDKITDGAIVFECYLPWCECEGTFTVPVSKAHDIQ